jgi:spore photoproduct lyase
MIETIYIEKEIKDHSRCEKVLKKIKPKRIILIKRYTEIFNRKNQSYLLQKIKPSLIIAKKYGQFFHRIKTNDSIGENNNYYFSCVYNCPFSCMYCFLQGIYRSSNYLVFINFEDFQKEIETKIIESKKKLCFFAGYDSDTLATDYFSGFIDEFYPFFEKHQNTLFEIRTKATNISSLILKKPIDNLVIAFSLNPDIIIKKIELKTPSLSSRLDTINKLVSSGFKIGLRFDPVIYFKGFEDEYTKFFNKVFSCVNDEKIHSITLGSVRYPFKYFENMKNNNIYPEFLASLKSKNKNRISYENEKDILDFCKNEICKFNKNLFIHYG